MSLFAPGMPALLCLWCYTFERVSHMWWGKRAACDHFTPDPGTASALIGARHTETIVC